MDTFIARFADTRASEKAKSRASLSDFIVERIFMYLYEFVEAEYGVNSTWKDFNIPAARTCRQWYACAMRTVIVPHVTIWPEDIESLPDLFPYPIRRLTFHYMPSGDDLRRFITKSEDSELFGRSKLQYLFLESLLLRERQREIWEALQELGEVTLSGFSELSVEYDVRFSALTTDDIARSIWSYRLSPELTDRIQCRVGFGPRAPIGTLHTIGPFQRLELEFEQPSFTGRLSGETLRKLGNPGFAFEQAWYSQESAKSQTALFGSIQLYGSSIRALTLVGQWWASPLDVPQFSALKNLVTLDIIWDDTGCHSFGWVEVAEDTQAFTWITELLESLPCTLSTFFVAFLNKRQIKFPASYWIDFLLGACRGCACLDQLKQLKLWDTRDSEQDGISLEDTGAGRALRRLAHEKGFEVHSSAWDGSEIKTLSIWPAWDPAEEAR